MTSDKKFELEVFCDHEKGTLIVRNAGDKKKHRLFFNSKKSE